MVSRIYKSYLILSINNLFYIIFLRELILLKTKIVSNTYLKDITKYRFKMYFDEEDFYVSVKKVLSCSQKFVLKNNLTVIDNGYYILEVIPKNEDYAMRVFLNPNKKPLEYYFDICENIRLDEKFHIPMYDDLYLDVTYLFGKINVIDEDELLNAYEQKEFTQKKLEHIYQVKDRLVKEIKEHTNPYINKDYSKYLEDI